MSWDSYIDNLIDRSKDSNGTAHCDRVCIISLDGGAFWTNTSFLHPNGLKLTPSEASNIAQCFKSKDFSSFMAGGVHVEGTAYLFLKEVDGKIVMAKRQGSGALTLQASKTAIVIGHVAEGCQHGHVNIAVGDIAEYLESINM